MLAEDDYLVREGVRRLLETRDDVEVVAVCEDFDSLVASVDAEHPDVVVTDIRMPPTETDEGIRVADHLREAHPDVGVVVLSQYASASYVLPLLEAGSARRAYLLKEGLRYVFTVKGEAGKIALDRWLSWARRCRTRRCSSRACAGAPTSTSTWGRQRSS